MAIKNIIARGIGFSPGSVKFIITLGFSIGAVVAPPVPPAKRILIIQAEDRVLAIPAESRTLIMPTEDRTIVI